MVWIFDWRSVPKCSYFLHVSVHHAKIGFDLFLGSNLGLTILIAKPLSALPHLSLNRTLKFAFDHELFRIRLECFFLA